MKCLVSSRYATQLFSVWDKKALLKMRFIRDAAIFCFNFTLFEKQSKKYHFTTLRVSEASEKKRWKLSVFFFYKKRRVLVKVSCCLGLNWQIKTNFKKAGNFKIKTKFLAFGNLGKCWGMSSYDLDLCHFWQEFLVLNLTFYSFTSHSLKLFLLHLRSFCVGLHQG